MNFIDQNLEIVILKKDLSKIDQAKWRMAIRCSKKVWWALK